MALLNDADRQICYGLTIEEIMRLRQDVDITTAELRAAVNDADQWVDDNASSFNAALPLPARTSLTQQQKAFLLVKVVERRYLVGV